MSNDKYPFFYTVLMIVAVAVLFWYGFYLIVIAIAKVL